MTTHKSHHIGRLTALTLTVALLTAAPVFAAPTTTDTTPGFRAPAQTDSELGVPVDPKTEEFRKKLDAKQQELDAFTAQLQQLDTELEIASEDYNASVDRLAQMKQNVKQAQTDLDNAKAAYAMQAEVLGDRAASIYRTGEVNAVEILLDSKSVSDFMARVKFLNTIGLRDADIAESLAAQKTQLEQRVEELKTAEAQAESLEFEMKARQIEITTRIEERQQLLADAQSELVTMLDAEAARRQAENERLFQEIVSGASSKGISVVPGSPVETALAYHGIPYLWGGETPAGFDCSGLMLYVFKQHGVTLPHYSGSQFQLGTKVELAELQPGDAVFFGSPIHHVGMYIGGGYYIHAPRTGDFVKISKLADRSDFAGARRYAWTYRVGEPLNAVKTTAEALRDYR